MVLAEFTITVHYEQPRAVRVVVYDSVKGLRIAASRYDNKTKRRKQRQRGAYADTLGVCHRFEWTRPDGESHPECAIVRLAEPHLGVGIVSHELTHAAVWFRELNDGDAPLRCDNDEEFCLVLGDLIRQTANVLIDRGIWT